METEANGVRSDAGTEPRWSISARWQQAVLKGVKHAEKRLVTRQKEVELMIYDDRTSGFQRALFPAVTVELFAETSVEGRGPTLVPALKWAAIAELLPEPSVARARSTRHAIRPVPCPLSRRERAESWRPKQSWRAILRKHRRSGPPRR